METGLCDDRVESVAAVRLVDADIVIKFDIIDRINLQVQHNSTVTAVSGFDDTGVRRGTDGRFGDIEAVLLVGDAFAKGVEQHRGVQLMHKEVQHHETVAAALGVIMVDIETRLNRLGQRESVLVVGGVRADVVNDGVTELLTHVEGQGHDTVAAVDGAQICRVNATLSERHAVEIVAGIGADGGGEADVVVGVYVQMQNRGAVAAEDVLVVVRQGVGVCGGEGGVETVAGVGDTLANVIRQLNVVDGIDDQVQGDDTVAAEAGLQVPDVEGVDRDCSRDVEAVLVVNLTHAEGRFQIGGGGLVYNQIQGGGAVTTVHVVVNVVVVVGLRRVLDVESVIVVVHAVAGVSHNVASLFGIFG